MITVTLLTQADCAFCDHAKKVLARVAAEQSLVIEEIPMETPQGRELAARGGVLFAPGVFLDGQPFSYGRLSEKRLRREIDRRFAATQR
jgi:glutaredoxin